MHNKFLGNLALFTTALIWGLSFVAQRAGMDYIEPFTFNMIRSILGGLSLIPLIIFTKILSVDTRTKEIKHVQHVTLGKAGIGCGLALFIALSIQQYCMQYVSAGKAGFISAMYIIFVPILTILYGDKLSKNIIISIFLSLCGMYFLCFKSDGCFCVYDLLTLLSAFFYAIHIIVVNYYSDKVHAIKASCLQFFVVAILSFVLVLLFENPNIHSIIDCKVPLLFAGILTCGGAYTLQMYGQKYTLPTVASLILCMESVFALLGGVIILGETVGIKESIGCLFMIISVILANTQQKKTI